MPSAVTHFYSGQPMHFYSGVDKLHYQPIFDLRDGSLKALEALLRAKPESKLGGPAEFIPIAEEVGLIREVGVWVLEEVCRQIKAWGSALPAGIRVASNVSAVQVRSGTFAETALGILAKQGVDPRRIEIELTETAMMEDLDTTLAAIRELRGAGIEVMIDDFGTGYSSLGYLSQLPITGLKIDRSFIRDIDKGGQDYIVTDAIVRLAKALGLRTVAEGIEGVDTLNLLADLGCDSGQGYHFARPMPGEEIARRFLTASTV